MKTTDLLSYIFSVSLYNTQATRALDAEVAGWVAASPYFKEFMEQYREKVRKKVRGVRNEEGRRNLQAELAVAHRLLQDRRFSVEYEAYGAMKRGPDFTVSYRTRTALNVEVTRLRFSLLDQPSEAMSRAVVKLSGVICAKLGQLPVSAANLLLVVVEGLPSTSGETILADATKQLKLRAEGKDDPFFTAWGFAGARDFLRQYPRLSAAMLCWWGVDGAGQELWTNREAKHPLSAEVSSAFLAAMS